jgi:hypothetical protein
MKIYHLYALLVFSFLPASPLLADFDSAVAEYRRSNYLGAIEAFLPLAQEGDARAQSILALMYRYGEGTPQDLGSAFMWYKKAAELDYAPAQYHAGIMLAEGIGVEADFEGGLTWLTRASQAGFSRADIKIEELNAPAVARATKHFEPWSQNWDFSLPNDVQFQNKNELLPADGNLVPQFSVHLGTMDSKQLALSMWDILIQIEPRLFEGLSPVIQESVKPDQTLYEVETGPFESIEQAKSFCSDLTERVIVDCSPIIPALQKSSSQVQPKSPILASDPKGTYLGSN